MNKIDKLKKMCVKIITEEKFNNIYQSLNNKLNKNEIKMSNSSSIKDL